MMQVPAITRAHTFATTTGASFKPITDNEEHVFNAPVANAGESTAIGKLGPFTTGPRPQSNTAPECPSHPPECLAIAA
jgi:hypothetical protein